MGDLERMIEARKLVEEFFAPKRRALAAAKEDSGYVKVMKMKMLGEINALAGDIEHMAIGLAERKKDPHGAIEKAEKEMEKLKKQFIKEVEATGPGEMLKAFGLPPEHIKGKSHELLETIKSL